MQCTAVGTNPFRLKESRQRGWKVQKFEGATTNRLSVSVSVLFSTISKSGGRGPGRAKGALGPRSLPLPLSLFVFRIYLSFTQLRRSKRTVAFQLPHSQNPKLGPEKQ